MHSYRSDLDEKIRQHLEFSGFITSYWQEQGWLKLYGKEYVQWLLEFLVPDIRSSEVQCAAEHLAELRNLLENYSLKQYLDDVPGSAKTLARTVKRGKV